MDGNSLIEFISNNVDPFVTAVGSVTGAIFTAIFLRNKTATTEFEKIKAGKFEEVTEDLLKNGKMTYTEFYKAKNFLKVAKKADAEYAKKSHGERTSPYDFDWFIRFYEAVGNISNEEMQNIWARILAGEIDKPNTFSIQTIEVLKNINQKDAELFKKVCSHCVHVGSYPLFPNYVAFMEKCDILFGEIWYLSNLGLISCISNLSFNVSIGSTPVTAFNNDELVFVVSAKEDKTTKFEIKQFPMTPAGDELSSVLHEDISNDDFLFFANMIKAESIPKYNVAVHRIESTDGENLEYNSDVDLLKQGDN